MTAEKFSVVFDNDIFQVKTIVDEAMAFLLGIFPNLSEDAAFETKLVLNEALLNAVKHGNKMNDFKKVYFNINAYENGSATFEIADEGAGFDYAAVLSVESGDGLLSETGRGVKLVHSLSDEVHYNKSGNIIKIHKKVVSDE